MMGLQTMTAAAAPAAAAPADRAQSGFNWAGVDWATILLNWGVALVIVLVGMWLARRLSTALEHALTRARVETTLSSFLRNVSYAVLLVLVFVTALTKIGVPATSLATVLGAAGLAVGLALKDSLSNIASGVMLIVLRPFRDGDQVKIVDMEGIVEEIRIFQTRIRTFDGQLITLPNSNITTAPIINYTALPTRRMMITVGVGYGDDLKKAQEILLGVARSNPLVLDDPGPFVQVGKLGESSVDLLLFAHANNEDFGSAGSTVIESIHNELLANGISIPYPQRDLHVYHHDADGKSLAELLAKSAAGDGDTGKGKPSVSSD